ncbi:TRAF3-interacting protein 1 [Anabrus simplex]|uniref:TRAF3-interacting protein 1 n=1 Tax=Anabrus simplex TaxID=316456 RepID=UPI0035A2F835
MAEDVKPEVIKRTQDSLGKYIKRPPLTEKLLKKPPFRFLHDIVTSVIRDTGFLQGLLTDEELNHENIKDRESKVAFLQKVIDAVKAITGANLTVRPTKIVAGHEATKTNELLQAIGSALDNKLSSADYVAQTQKKEKGSKVKASSSKDDLSKNKTSTTSKTTGQSRGPSQERSKNKEPSKKKISTDNTKRSKAQTEKKTEEEQGAAADSVSAVAEVTPEQPAKPRASTSKSDTPLPEKNKSTSSENENPISGPSQPEKHEADASQSEKLKTDSTLAGKRRPDSAHREKLKSAKSIKPDLQFQPSTSEVEPQPNMQQEVVSHMKELDAGKFQEEADQTAKEPEVIRPRTAHENRRKSARLKSAKVPKPEGSAVDVDAKGEISSGSLRGSLGGAEPTIIGNRDPAVPLPRPKSVRPKSARPPHARPKSRIEVVTADETVEGEGKVKVITETDPFREQDEDDNFVVVEAPPVLLEDTPFAPTSTQALQPGENSQHGHLVAQILETQKELEDDAQRSLPHDSQNKKMDIEWDDAGRQREREIVSKEVERLRTSIQTLTRAANPLGKLMDFLQEDVDTMQRELRNWRIMNNDLRKQLLEEERKTELSIEPLKARLKELNEKIDLKLDEISSVKARIMENEDSIHKNAIATVDMDPELEEKLKKLALKYIG